LEEKAYPEAKSASGVTAIREPINRKGGIMAPLKAQAPKMDELQQLKSVQAQATQMDQLQRISMDELAFVALKELIMSTNPVAIWTAKQDELAKAFIAIVSKSSGKRADGGSKE